MVLYDLMTEIFRTAGEQRVSDEIVEEKSNQINDCICRMKLALYLCVDV